MSDKLTRQTCVVAVGRAEEALKNACDNYEKEIHSSIKRILVVNEAFTYSSEYKGDETNGNFEIIVFNFDDQELLKKFTQDLKNYEVIMHCRYEPSIQDYAKLIPYLENNFVQSPESLRVSTIKSEMRQAFNLHYPEISPRYKKIISTDEVVAENFRDFNFPVIVKPTGLNSSWLVNKCDDLETLVSTLKTSFDKLSEAYKQYYGSGLKAFIVEEFMVGEMYSIDAYTLNDDEIVFLPPTRIITSYEVGKDGFYCYRSMTDIDLTEDQIYQANLCVKKAILSVGLNNSTVHAELYNTPNGWKIIEIAPRIGGGKQFLCKEAFGIDHFYNDLLIHAGKKPNVIKSCNRSASGFSMYSDAEGVIKDIKGLDEARSIKSLKRLSLNLKPGDLATFASKGGDFVLMIVR